MGLTYRGRYQRKIANLQLTLQQTKIFNLDDYIWFDLGWTQIGVTNEEGYSKEYIAIGFEVLDSTTNKRLMNTITKIDIVKVTQKFYYSHANIPHHEEERYFNWNGKLIDYLDVKRRKLWK